MPRQKTRDRILETACRLFYTRGINATGIDVVIAEAGVAKGSMYHHFRNKQALVVAYLEEEEALWKLASVAGDDPGASPAERLAMFFDRISADVIAGTFHGCPFMNAGIERPDDTDIHRVIAHYRRELASHLATLVGAEASSMVVLKLMVLYDGAKVTAKLTRDPALVQLAADMACATVSRSSARRQGARNREPDTTTPESRSEMNNLRHVACTTHGFDTDR